MPKLKTPNAISSRFLLTKRKKVLHRKAGQDHFNARERGNTTRNKRRDVSLSPAHARFVARILSQ